MKVIKEFEINGQRVVYLKFEDGDGALAYPHQIDARGQIKMECQFEPGYAHVKKDGTICRFRQTIGNIDAMPANAIEPDDA